MNRMTPEQAKQLRDRLTAANPETLLTKLEAEAAKRLREAGYPDTVDGLEDADTFSQALPANVRNAADILWCVRDLRLRTSGTGPAVAAARDTFADTARLFAYVISSTLDDDAPRLRAGARVLRGSAKGNAKKKRDSEEAKAEVIAEFERAATENLALPKNRRLTRGKLYTKVAANLCTPDRKISARTIQRYVAEPRRK